MRWRVGELLEESERRLTWRHTFPTLLVLMLSATLTYLGGFELNQAEEAAHNQLAQGITVFGIEPQDSVQPLEAQQCEQLNHSAIVESAGPIYLAEPASWMPADIELSTMDMTLGALRVWWPEVPSNVGIYLGQDLSSAMTIFPGAQIAYTSGPTNITAMQPDYIKDAQLRASVVRIVGPQRFAIKCLVRVVPGYQESMASLVQIAFPHENPVVTPHARLDDLSADPESMLSSGATNWLWAAGIGVFALATALRGLMARSEVGIYRSLGTKRLELFIMSSMQSSTLVLPAGMIGVVIGTSLAWWFTDVSRGVDALWYMIFPGLMVTFGSWLVAPIVEQIVTAGAIVDQLKE